MSSFLYRTAAWVIRHAKSVLAGWIIVLIAAVGGMVAVGSTLGNDFTIPGTQGQQGLDTLDDRFPEFAGASGQVVFGAPKGEDIHRYQSDIEDVAKKISKVPHVIAAPSPFDDTLMDPMVSDNNRYAMTQVNFDFGIDELNDASVNQVEKIAHTAQDAGLSVDVGGQIKQVTSIPLSIMEAVGVLVALVILVVTFRSLIAAFIPIATGLLGVGVAMSIIMMLGEAVTISTTTPTLAIMLGLAVGIDYSLFIVSRHRDQLGSGMDVKESIPLAIATSGSAVTFAGVTVVIALAALFVARIPFLTIMGLCAALAVALAVLVAITALPAILMLLGNRIKPKARKKKKNGFLSRWPKVVTAHPWFAILGVVAVLVAMTVPAYNLRLGLPDNGVDPVGSAGRDTYDLVAEEFGPGINGPILVIGDIVTSTDPLGLMDDLKGEIESIKGVDHVQLATPNRTADLGVAVVIPREGPDSIATENLVHELRERAPKWSDDIGIKNTFVTGMAAVKIDVSERLFDALLPFGVVVVGLSLGLLTIVFRSIWVPLKATLGYLLSVGAAFGMTTLVFIDGWGNTALGINQVGPVISFMPIILMGVLFGLAMDYELFLVSRMREDYVRTNDPHHSILTGFRASAPVVIAAALIMISVFSGFLPGGSFYVQPIAFGLAVGVFVDAFLVRMTLVPAVMQLLGAHAWYLPRWMQKILPVFDVEGAAIEARFEHEKWQEEHGQAAARAESLTVTAGSTPLFENVDLVVRPGEVLRLTGDEAQVHALCSVLAGRLRPDAGQAFVGDVSSVDEPGRVLPHVGWIVTGQPVASTGVSLYIVRRALTESETRVLKDNVSGGSAVVLGCGPLTGLEVNRVYEFEHLRSAQLQKEATR